MPDSHVRRVRCPTCGQPVDWIESNEHRPFCSRRCRDSDFCDWADEQHVIATEQSHSDVFSEDLE